MAGPPAAVLFRRNEMERDEGGRDRTEIRGRAEGLDGERGGRSFQERGKTTVGAANVQPKIPRRGVETAGCVLKLENLPVKTTRYKWKYFITMI